MVLRQSLTESSNRSEKLEESMRDLVPGGYLFTHLVFWTVVGLVAVGTNAVAIILMVGLGMMVVETVKGA
jgi:hypothetical protein